MEDKSLADKAVSIKGKAYVLVQDRVLYFNETYPNGSIKTDATFYPESKMWSVKATVRIETGVDSPNSFREFTGHSQAVIGEGMVNKTAALENAETSAVGRALAFMGIGVIESIASADEMVKASVAPKTAPGRTETSEAENREKAKRDRTKWLLGKLGYDMKNPSLADVAEAISKEVSLDLSSDDLDVINEALASKTPKK